MVGGGSIQGMITSLRNNKELLRSKRFFSKERTFLSIKKEYLKAAGGKIAFKNASQNDILKIREKIVKARKKESAILFLVSLIIILFIFYCGFRIIEYDYIVEEKQRLATFKEKETEFLLLIEQGDEWFIKARWHNSIFNYRKAKNLFPNNYEINYRLVYAYSLQCENDFKNCHLAKALLDQLLIKFPEEQQQLFEVKNRLKYEY